MSAVLEIRGDASGVLRALASIEPASRRAAASISASFRRSDAAMTESARQAGRKMAQAYAQAATSARALADATAAVTRRAAQRQTSDVTRAAAARTTAVRSEAREAVRSAEQIAAARARGERQATAASVREASRRASVDRQRAREAGSAARAVAASEREAAQATAASVREAGRRAALDRQRTGEAAATQRAAAQAAATTGRSDRRFGGHVAAVATAGLQFAGQAHGMIQDARGRRAETSHTMSQALYQAGADSGDAAELRERMYSFARTHGMDSGELASAANAVQTEFSTLGDSRSSQGTRRTNVDNFLQTQLFARDTGQSGAEVARVAGMLQNTGLDAGAQRSTLLALTGMAQRGAVELGSVSREAMSPMLQRMHDARTQLLQRNPAATPQEIAAEQGGAAQAAFAEIEVARGQGASPRRFARVMAGLGTELQGSHRQGMLLTNINNAQDITDAQRTGLRGMFDHGRLRAQFQSGAGFAGHVSQVLGGNEAAMRNVFAGSGAGNAQSMQTNWRDAIAMMMSGGPELQRMLAGAGAAFTEEDVGRGGRVFGGEDKTSLTRDHENNQAALTTNTGAMGRLSDAFTSFVARNPLLAAGGSTAAGLLGPGAASMGGAAIPAAVRSASAVAAAGGVAGGAVMALGAVVAGGAGLGIGEGINRAIDSANPRARDNGQQNISSVFSGQTWRELWGGLVDALRSQPLLATVTPTAAAHAAAQSRTGGSVTPAGTGR